MSEQVKRGLYRPTLAAFYWRLDRPTFILGVNQDGRQLNVDAAERNGADSSRCFGFPGGGSLVDHNLLILVFCVEHEYDGADWTIHKQSDRAGTVTTEALRSLGLDAHYRSLADTEIAVPGEDIGLKIGSTSAAHFLDERFWSFAVSIAWGMPSDEAFRAFGESVYVPPQKFADKRAKSAKERMDTLQRLLGESAGTPHTLMAKLARQQSIEYFGAECLPESLMFAEQRYIKSMSPFFHSRSWINSASTIDYDRPGFDGERIGRVTLKRRKLIDCTIGISPDHKISRVMFTGEYYIHPQAAIRSRGGSYFLEEAIRGLDARDLSGIEQAVNRVFERPEFETPMLTSGDFVAAISAAIDNATATT